MTEDTKAIDRLRRGDIGGLESLVRRYGTNAVRAAYLITGDAALAEDIVQTAFITFSQRADLFDPTRPFKPYFMRIIANDAIRSARQSDRFSSLDAPISGDSDLALIDRLVDPSDGPEAAVEREELRGEVRAALRRLTPEQRATVVLRYYLELSDEQIAGELAVAPSTVRGRLRLARKRLRGLLLRGLK